MKSGLPRMSKTLEQHRSENQRRFETKTSKIMLALQKELSHLQIEQKNKLQEMKFKREQFKRRHSHYRGKIHSRFMKGTQNKPEILPQSFQPQIDKWMTSVSKYCVDKGPKIYFQEEQAEENCCGAEDSKSVSDRAVSTCSALPRIVVSTDSDDNWTNQDPFVTKIKESEVYSSLDIPEDYEDGLEFLPRINAPRKISCISLPSRRLSIPVPARLRSTSLPNMSKASRLQVEATLAANNNLETLGVSARGSEGQVVGRRSVGVSTSRVISDLHRGIMYSDLDEREDVGVSDEQWEEVRHCRYLRNHRYSL